MEKVPYKAIPGTQQVVDIKKLRLGWSNACDLGDQMLLTAWYRNLQMAENLPSSLPPLCHPRNNFMRSTHFTYSFFHDLRDLPSQLLAARQIHLIVPCCWNQEIPTVDGRNPASQLLGSFAQRFTELFPKKQDRNSNHQKSRKQCRSLQVNLFKGKPLWWEWDKIFIFAVLWPTLCFIHLCNLCMRNPTITP